MKKEGTWCPGLTEKEGHEYNGPTSDDTGLCPEHHSWWAEVQPEPIDNQLNRDITLPQSHGHVGGVMEPEELNEEEQEILNREFGKEAFINKAGEQEDYPWQARLTYEHSHGKVTHTHSVLEGTIHDHEGLSSFTDDEESRPVGTTRRVPALEDSSASVHEAQVTDNPFSGTGRPFSNDNELMSERYFQDNPATSTGPYSADSSYSINNVAPYHPAGAGLENPSQNVGPYDPPAYMPETTDGDFDEDDLLSNVGAGNTDANLDIKAAHVQWEDSHWYDGEAKSIYSHILDGEKIKTAAEKQGDVQTASTIDEQIEVLRKVAAEIDESNLDEYLDDIPGGSIAMEYDDLQDGGLVDPTSFLHTTAAQMINEANAVDWDTFSDRGAKNWIALKINDNPGLLNHEIMTREAAVDYIKDKTMVVLDAVRRANVIDNFVTNVERYRREASRSLHDALLEEKAINDRKDAIRNVEAKRQVLSTDVDEFLPGEYVEYDPAFVDGQINIGEDDGSFMYEAAKEVIASTDREWAEFTTEGAKDWFIENVANSPMVKYPDTTYRAARRFVEDETSLIKNASQRDDIVRAFTESVEYLREQQENKQQSKTASVERSDFDEIYSDESEILW